MHYYNEIGWYNGTVDRRAYKFSDGLIGEILMVEFHSYYWEVHYQRVVYVDDKLVDDDVRNIGFIKILKIGKDGPFPKPQDILVKVVEDWEKMVLRREGKTLPADSPELITIPLMPWEIDKF